MINIAEQIKTIERELDRQVLEGCTSGWMEENASQVINNGDGKILIPKTSHQETHPNVTYFYKSLTLTQCMNNRFRIDPIDVDDNGFGFAAANAMAEYQRTKVIPQIDTYRYSYLAKIAGIRETYTPERSTVIHTLINQIEKVKDCAKDNTDIIIIMSRPVYDKIMLVSENTSYIKSNDFKQGSLTFPVKTICNIPVLPVPSARMKTEYYFTDNSFESALSAKSINWIICPKSVPIAVSKTDNVKIITPEANQFADAWGIDYRKYHDLFVPESMKNCIAVSISEI